MRSKAPLALMEQTIMVLVFALAAALCLRVFVWSNAQSLQARNRDQAALLCQSAAEAVRHAGSLEAAKDRFGMEWGQDSTLLLYYDKDWNPVSGLDGAYCMTVQREPDLEEPGLGRASVRVSEAEGETLFELPIAWQEVD